VARQYPPPATYLAEGGTWPDGPFGPDAPVLTVAAAQYTAAVRAELERRGWSIARLARETGMTASWTSRMLRGLAWADMDAVVRIEQVLQVSFFPEDSA
jgi:ribosome-binding protein aMBF1 (putative translation factor)